MTGDRLGCANVAASFAVSLAAGVAGQFATGSAAMVTPGAPSAGCFAVAGLAAFCPASFWLTALWAAARGLAGWDDGLGAVCAAPVVSAAFASGVPLLVC